jgi:hypothetical protein
LKKLISFWGEHQIVHASSLITPGLFTLRYCNVNNNGQKSEKSQSLRCANRNVNQLSPLDPYTKRYTNAIEKLDSVPESQRFNLSNKLPNATNGQL